MKNTELPSKTIRQSAGKSFLFVIYLQLFQLFTKTIVLVFINLENILKCLPKNNSGKTGNENVKQ